MLRAFRKSLDEALFARGRGGRGPMRFSGRRPPRFVLVGLGVLFALAIVASFSAGPLLRRQISREADRRNLEIDVGSAHPGFFSVSLRDLYVRPRGVEGLEARIDSVRIDLGLTLSVESISATGGRIVLSGEPDELLDKVRSLRGPAGTGVSQGPRSQRPISMENFALSWKLPSGGELTGAGLRASRSEAGIRAGCTKCGARHSSISLDATDLELELGPDFSPHRVGASTLVISRASSRSATSSTPTASPSVEPIPPPLPPISSRGVRKVKAPAPASPAVPDEPVLPLPDLHALRTRIATAMAAVGPRVPEGAKVEIGGLSVKIDVGGEPVAFGPGAFTLLRSGDRVRLDFATAQTVDGAAPVGTPLSIDADLPIGAGELTARLAGGPVSLAVLGVQEGTKGLTDVARGTVSGKGQLVLAAGGDALTFDGQLALRSVAMKQPRISPEPLRGLDFSVSARGVLDDAGRLRGGDAGLAVGALHVKTHGTVEETPSHFAVSLAADVVPAACQSLLDSAPQGLLPTVRSARIAGTFAATATLAFDTRTIDKLALDYRIDDQCKMVEVPPDLSRDRFGDAFTYRTYKPDGTIGETTTGPGTASWTNLDDISPFMVAAVLTTEDGAFYKHKGFNHAAIRSSVQANLKARRFVRGASTITMQLAKNLFLARDKALSRKIEEVILTNYLEQIFRKDDMMELYLNVVEFGPDVYGITAAAEYYFGRKPEELNVAECYFLASLLPAPLRYGKFRDKGEVSETWMRHLVTLMEIGARNGKITKAELEEGRKAPVVFVRAGDPRPEPRKPVTASRRDVDGDDGVWRPLE